MMAYEEGDCIQSGQLALTGGKGHTSIAIDLIEILYPDDY
jgi:hypothetical protein